MSKIKYLLVELGQKKYPSQHLEHLPLPPYTSCRPCPHCFKAVGWEVGLELPEVPSSTGWGQLPTHPYFDKAAGVTVFVLVFGLVPNALDRQEVGGVGSLVSGVEGLSSRNTS